MLRIRITQLCIIIRLNRDFFFKIYLYLIERNNRYLYVKYDELNNYDSFTDQNIIHIDDCGIVRLFCSYYEFISIRDEF